MATQAALAQKALDAKDFNEAITQYDRALQYAPTSPIYLIGRSTAYHRAGKHDLALRDAEDAIYAAQARARRELIAKAHFRRGVVYHGMGRYADARMCFIWGRKLDEKLPGLGMWQAKVATDYDKLPEDSPHRQISIKEFPDKRVEPSALSDKTNEDDTSSSNGTTKDPKGAPAVTPTSAQATSPAVTPKEKIRHDWMQSNEKVTISIFARGVPMDKTSVKIDSQTVDVNFPTSAHSSYDFSKTLFGPIDPSSSSYTITPNKIELTLRKAQPVFKWSVLEASEDSEAAQTAITQRNASAVHTAPKEDKPPAYPTSSRKGPVNWDKEASNALGGDDADGVDDFFKKLYKDADPDTRRAMVKSFQESNGTTLSTDWTDVGKKSMETHPPEGVEAKKW